MRTISNKALDKALANEGLKGVSLIKDNGFFWITSSDEEISKYISCADSDCIYMCYFGQQSVSDWVYDIKKIIENGKSKF